MITRDSCWVPVDQADGSMRRCAAKTVARIVDHYRATSDRNLVARLSHEDHAEELGHVPAQLRVTCRLHRRWVHQCIGSPVHVIPVTGHRWCVSCDRAVTVEVDDMSGSIVMACPGCGKPPSTPVNAQIMRNCVASVAEWRGHTRGIKA